MRRQEDRDAALAQLVDQLVDIARGDRIETGGRLVEEQHLGLAEQRPGQGDPLAETLGERAAGIAGPLGQLDRPQRPLDARARVRHLVQVGEAARFSATLSRRYSPGDSGMIEIRWRISTPLSGRSAKPATVAVPDVGAISVPSVRTVVVLPAPFGPRKPKTSP